MFDSTFCSDACSVLSTLPRSGRIACVLRSRPCLAEPPAESPSTMNSSLLPGSVDEQSASLPGRFSRCETAVLRDTACAAARDASRALAASAMRSTICAPAVLFSSRKRLQRRADRAVDLRLRLRAAEPLLGLPLELRLLHVDREHADDALADVLGGQRHALGRQVRGLDEGAHRLDDRRAKALLVRPALRGRDAVDVGADGLLVRLGPLQRHLDAEPGLAGALEVEDLRRGRRLAAVGDQLGQEVGDAARVLEGLRRARRPRRVKMIFRPLCRKALASRRKRIVSAEKSCLPKISGSGRKMIEVPVPRAAPTLLSLLTALPRS